MLKYVASFVRDMMDMFSVGIVSRGAVCVVYGKLVCFVVQMLYVCSLCAASMLRSA